jgi:prephenate dehydrogenase
VFVALPPKNTIDYIVNTDFKSGAIVADICGVKRAIEDAIYSANLQVKYVGTHPMAGKEVSGIKNACADLFDRASMVVTHGEYTDEEAVKTIKQLVKDMGFKRIVECSAVVHDKKIAYTSQLAHIVSNSYVKDDEIDSCLGFTGGSFQDMTRIAGVDEQMWAELYLTNSDNIVEKVSTLIDNLTNIRDAIKDNDKDKLCSVLREGKERFINSKSGSPTTLQSGFLNGEILTTILK